MYDPETGMIFANRAYRYAITGSKGDDTTISEMGVVNGIWGGQVPGGGEIGVTRFIGLFEKLGVEIRQVIGQYENGLEETLTLRNTGDQPVKLEKIEIGFCADLDERSDWRLCAIPFKVQLDGSRHDYPVRALADGLFKNAVFEDSTRKFMPPLNEGGSLRSEAWAWGTGDAG